MPDQDDPFASSDGYAEGTRETYFAQQRVPDRFYASKSFTIERPASSDYGQSARFVHKVFDNNVETRVDLEGEEYLISTSPGGRVQVKLLVAREVGRIKELWIQRIPTSGNGKATVSLNLKSEAAQRLVDLLKTLDHMPVAGAPETQRIDDSLIRMVLDDPHNLDIAYRQDRDRVRTLIENDSSSPDVIALAHRRQQVARFHELLENDDAFAKAVTEIPGNKKEGVWQNFFEANPWILGLSLNGQLLTSWDDEKLEKIVAGRTVAGVGKRADALLATSGRIRSMVFAEFKTHQTPLLSTEYRDGCWAPSTHVSGGVSQVQGTIHRASTAIGERLALLDKDGAERLGEFGYLLRPKSYLVVGRLGEFVGASGGHHVDKVRSFELYRRQLVDPEIVTFDELLARADWLVAS